MANRKELEEMVNDYCVDVMLPSVDLGLVKLVNEHDGVFGFIPLDLENNSKESWVDTLDGDVDPEHGEINEDFYGARDYYVRFNDDCVSFWSEAKDLGFLIYKIK